MVSNVSPAGSAAPFAAPKKTKAVSPQFGGSSKTQKAAKADTFNASAKFRGNSEPGLVHRLFRGLAGTVNKGSVLTGLVCFPTAIGLGALGILLHPLLPVAGLVAAVPMLFGAYGGIKGFMKK